VVKFLRTQARNWLSRALAVEADITSTSPGKGMARHLHPRELPAANLMRYLVL